MVLGMAMAPAFVMSSTVHGTSNPTSYGSHSAAGQKINDLAIQPISTSKGIFELQAASKTSGSQLVKEIPWDCLLPVTSSKREALIAQGGFSMVLKGILKCSAGDMDVAIKVLSGSDDYDKLLSDAMEEASITMGIAAQMLSTDGVVKIYGVASGPLTSDWAKVLNVRDDTSCVAIVMKYEEGGSLAQLIYPKRFVDLKAKLSLLKSLADVLRQMHDVGGVHGDLKPQNILLSDRASPMARLADFGLSDIRPVQFNSKTVSTTGGITRGTYRYCAPEMLPNPNDENAKIEKATASSDMFAFGTVAWELLAQEVPFGEVQSDVNLCASVWRGERPSLEATVVGVNVPQSVTSLIARCWQEDKSLRPSAKHCYEVLSEAYKIVSSKLKDIFFSYCWANKPILKYVLNMMTARGYNIWFDENNMKSNLVESMKEGIANSKVFLACISSKYESSKNCMFELNHVHRNHKDKAIIPLVLEKFKLYDATVTVTANTATGTTYSSTHGDWQMGKTMDSILEPEKIMYVSLSNIAARFEAEVAAGTGAPSVELLKDLEDALQGLFKLLDDVDCKPSFPAVISSSLSAAVVVAAPVTRAAHNSNKVLGKKSTSSVLLYAADPSPEPATSTQRLESDLDFNTTQQEVGIGYIVDRIKVALGIEADTSLLEAVEKANKLIGLKSEGSLPEQVHRLKVKIGIVTY